MDRHWFNLAIRGRWVRLPFVGRVLVTPWNLYNRLSTEDTWWGVGLLQIERSHALYVGHLGVCILGVWIFGRPD